MKVDIFFFIKNKTNLVPIIKK